MTVAAWQSVEKGGQAPRTVYYSSGFLRLMPVLVRSGTSSAKRLWTRHLVFSAPCLTMSSHQTIHKIVEEWRLPEPNLTAKDCGQVLSPRPSPLSDIVSRHSIKTGLLIRRRGKKRERRRALLLRRLRSSGTLASRASPAHKSLNPND